LTGVVVEGLHRVGDTDPTRGLVRRPQNSFRDVAKRSFIWELLPGDLQTARRRGETEFVRRGEGPLEGIEQLGERSRLISESFLDLLWQAEVGIKIVEFSADASVRSRERCWQPIVLEDARARERDQRILGIARGPHRHQHITEGLSGLCPGDHPVPSFERTRSKPEDCRWLQGRDRTANHRTARVEHLLNPLLDLRSTRV